MNSDYKTSDLNLAAFLVVKGFNCFIEKEGKKGYFIFDETDELKETKSEYYGNSEIPVLDYKNALRDLKSRVINF